MYVCTLMEAGRAVLRSSHLHLATAHRAGHSSACIWSLTNLGSLITVLQRVVLSCGHVEANMDPDDVDSTLQVYRSRGTVVGASVKVTSPLTLKLDIQLTLRLLNILYFIPVLRLVCITTLKVT